MKKRVFTVGICVGTLLLCGVSAGAADLTATLSNQPIYVDGERVWDMAAYDIGGNNYVKLRDMGMSVGFDVVYDASTDSVQIDPTIAYSGDPATYLNVEIPVTASAKLSKQPIYVQGKRVEITAYDIGGSNYMKLRDIGTAVGFGVTYDAKTDSVHIDPTTPYRESIKNQAYASAPEQNLQQEQDYFTGYETEEEALDAIFKHAAEETAKVQQDSVPQTDGQSEEDAVQTVFKLVNEAREAEGLAPMVLDDDLCKAAQIRAKELNELFSHTRPDGRRCSTVLEDLSLDTYYLYSGENAAGTNDLDANYVMEGWMSTSHRANILNPNADRIGIAVSNNNWIQFFARAV